MDRVGRLLLTVLLISAFSCIVQAKFTRYSIQFHETVAGSDTAVFRPLSPDPVQNKGLGLVKHNNATTTEGSVIGSVAGLYFFHSTDTLEDIITITFSTSLSGIWNGSSLNLRGRWKGSAAGIPAAEQELSIVGGQGGFRGASGSVYYERIQVQPTLLYLVTCDIFVDKLKYSMPKTHVDLNAQFKSEVHVSPEATDDALKQVVESS